MEEQILEFSPRAVALTGEMTLSDSFRLKGGFKEARPLKIYRGEAGLLQMIEEVDSEIIVNGISGAKGLLPSFKTLEVGKTLALANKETIVMAGPLIMKMAEKNGMGLIPVDSEHYAIFSMLQSIGREQVDEVVLTASGGAFRDLPIEQLNKVRVKDALKNPNWKMGPKITIDSATMANKGLEVIEAHYLYNIDLEKIKVVIHPQSYIHSLIRTIDGFLYAQISKPDMRMSIQNALTYPDLSAGCFGALELAGKEFSFYPVDMEKYRLLRLAYEAAEKGGAYPIVYNAANEVAVENYLLEHISFLEITALVEEALQARWDYPVETVDQILFIDQLARQKSVEILRSRTF